MERRATRSRNQRVHDYDDDALDRLADLLADRLAVRLGGLMPGQSEPLVDAAEIARLHSKTRWWVYEHAGELGAVRLGSGPRPRLGFSPTRVAVALRKMSDPEPVALPPRAKPQRVRRRRTDRTPSGAELLRVRGHDNPLTGRPAAHEPPRHRSRGPGCRCRPGTREARLPRSVVDRSEPSLDRSVTAANLHTESDVGPGRNLMAPRASGEVLPPDGRRRSFSLRFRAFGKRQVIKLGRPEDGWTMQMAERELAVVLRDVDLGTWRPARPDPTPDRTVDPTFHEFASDWFATKELEVEPNTANHYRNDLTNHLLPFFKCHHLSQITAAEVDRYRQSKVREAAQITAAAESGKPMVVAYVDRLGRRYRRRARPLSPRSINMHIDLLAQILAVAVDHGHLDSNPALGRRRRMKVSKPRPVHLDSAEQIALLLEAAGQLDRGEADIDVTDRRGRSWTQRHPAYTTGRRAALATLLLGGGRAAATGAMVWRDVDLANGRFEVGRDKTDAGKREVDMLPLLREILTEHKAASARTGPDDPVFVTAAGTPRSRHNLRQDVVDASVAHAHRLVEERGLQPLPLGITPHQLRHTFASILVAIGKDPTHVMQQLGHTDPAFTLRVYAHAMRRSEDERERLRALVEGHDWSQIGHKTAESSSSRSERGAR